MFSIARFTSLLVIAFYSCFSAGYSQPQLTSRLYPYWNSLWTVSGAEDILAIAAGWDGCVFYDVSDPDNPQYLTRYIPRTLAENVFSISDYWIISHRDGVDVVTYDGTGLPSRVGDFGIEDGLSSHFAISGDTLAHIYWFAPGLVECAVYDMSNPLQPTTLATIQLNQVPADIALDGEDLYLGYSDHVKLYSYAESEIALLDSLLFAGSTNIGLIAADSSLIVSASGHGLFRFTRSSIGQLALANERPMNLWYPKLATYDEQHICIVDQYIYMIEIDNDTGFTVNDSLLLGQQTVPRNAVKVSNDIFLGFGFNDTDYILPVIWNGHNLCLGEVFQECGNVNTMAYDQSFLAAIVDCTRIDLFNVSSMSNPDLLSSTSYSYLYPDIAFHDNTLIVAEPNAGFHLLSCQNPEQPVPIADIPFPDDWSCPVYLTEFITFSIQQEIGVFTFAGYNEEIGVIRDVAILDYSDIYNPELFTWRMPEPFDDLHALLHPNGEHLVLLKSSDMGPPERPQQIFILSRPDLGEVEVLNTFTSGIEWSAYDTWWLDGLLCVTGGELDGYPYVGAYNLDDSDSISVVAYLPDCGGYRADTKRNKSIVISGYGDMVEVLPNSENGIIAGSVFEIPHIANEITWFNNVDAIAIQYSASIELYSGVDDWLPVQGHQQRETHSLPQQIEISAYPNPFNSQTTFSFTIPNPGFYTIDIINILAQRTVLLYSGYLNIGHYQFPWTVSSSNSSFSSGVYFSRIIGENTNIHKIIMVK